MEMLILNIIRILKINIVKLDSITSNIFGCLSLILTAFFSFISPYMNIYISIMLIVLADTICALCVVHKTKRKYTSSKFSELFLKIIVYCGFLLMIQFIEKAVGEEWFIGIRIGCTLICATELWSIMGNLTILFPDFKFFVLIKKFLKGELANKLNCEEKEVDRILNGLNKKKK